MRITVDTSDLDSLAYDYQRTPQRVAEQAPAVLRRGAVNIRRAARAHLAGAVTGVYLPHYGRSIDFDEESGDGWFEVEIGPNAGMPQGGMGRGVEYGSAHTRPIPHLIPAWEDEQGRFDEWAERILLRSLP